MCLANPIYHPCSHSSVAWLHCPSKEASREEACSNIQFLQGEESSEPCPYKSCKFPGRDKGWICCHCQGGPNYTGWCTMPSLRSNRAFKASWGDVGPATCDHGCCKRCVKVKGKHQLPLSSRRNLNAYPQQTQWDSLSSTSASSAWSSTQSNESQMSSPKSSPPGSTDGNYTGHFGPADAALRGFYDKYVPHGSAMAVPDEPDWAPALEPNAHGYWGEPVESIPVQSVTVQKRRKDKGKKADSRAKRAKSGNAQDCKKSSKSRR